MKLRVFRGAGAFQRAREEAGENQVCGTYIGDEPAYFLAPRDVDDTEIQKTAFRIRHGRAMTDGEQFFAAAVKRHLERSG
jgi:hypothetical protein